MLHGTSVKAGVNFVSLLFEAPVCEVTINSDSTLSISKVFSEQSETCDTCDCWNGGTFNRKPAFKSSIILMKNLRYL